MFVEAERIEKEADFVDNVILKVQKRKEGTTELPPGSFSPKFVQCLSRSDLQQKLPPLLTPEDRVEFAGKHFTGLRIPQDVLKKYEKNAEVSRQLLNRGTELYKQRNFDGALNYYNVALLFAQTGTESVGIAYANRSAVLVELGRFEEALQDVGLALANKYPELRRQKLEQRKERSQKGIQKKQEEYLAIDPEMKKEMENEIQKIKKIRDGMLHVEKSNPLIPAAADVVELKYDAVRGRHLVVNQDVAAGSILLVEDPCTFLLYGQFKWDTEHCHHCLKRIWNGIPCENCVFAIYCDESCRQEAKTIHDYECKTLPSFHAMDAIDQLLKAVRILFKVGAKELFRIFETKDPDYLNPIETFGTGPNCVYDSQSYLSVFHLPSHPDKLSFIDRVSHAAYALMATQILEMETTYFEDIPADRAEKFKQFFATVIIRHYEADISNGTGVQELHGLESLSFVDKYCGKSTTSIMSSLKIRDIGGALYPVASLMSHYCDQNISALFHTTNGKIIAVAHRALKKGEPLHIMSSGGFLQSGICERQAYLEKHYHFKCQCVACRHNWPTLAQMMQKDPRNYHKLCCPVCSQGFLEDDKGSQEFRKCLMTAPLWKCASCGNSYEEDQLKRQLSSSERLTAEMINSLEMCCLTEAFDIFMMVTDFNQFYLCPPDPQCYVAQDLLRKTILLILYFAQQL